jgi:hypothetical protein
MKKPALCLTMLLVAAISAFGGGDKKDLMARMGFSKEEIAKDVAADKPATGTRGGVAGKSDPDAAVLVLREANEINKLRASSALRQQAERLAAEAEKRATLARIRAQGAEAKAEVAKRETRKLIYNDGISAKTFGDALDGREKFVREAEEARAVAEEEARNAEQVRVKANEAIAIAKAGEAKLEQEGLARAIAIRDRPSQR